MLVQGMKDTRVTLRRWNERPLGVLRPWFSLSLKVAVGLLTAVWLVAELTSADSTLLEINGITRDVEAADYLRVLFRNSLVLTLHALACVAGFIAGSAMPLSAANRSGLDRWVHEKAGRFAIAFVVCATTFSLVTQAYIIGGNAATVAGQLNISPALLIVGLLPHALLELIALFLPLAAWLIASRTNRWEELLAATVVTLTVAVPMLLVAVVIEMQVSPVLLEALAR